MNKNKNKNKPCIKSRGVQTDNLYMDPSKTKIPKKHDLKKKIRKDIYYYNLLNK